MIVQMKHDSTKQQTQKLIDFLTHKGFEIKDVSSDKVVIFGIIGDTKSLNPSDIEAFEGVFQATRVQSPYKLASRSFDNHDTVVHIKDDIYIGGGNFTVIAGTCSVETYEITDEVARSLVKNNVRMIRGGAFKPRTSPYAFQGLGVEGLKILNEIGKKYNIATVSEIMDIEDLDAFEKYIDVYQIGARNMQNFSLLKALGERTRKPIILKRGISATIEEWLMSAEYILKGGNPNVILCERGIRTFEKYTRNTLDIQSVLAVKELSHLPVIVDPSHASGRYTMIEKLSLASLAVGSDGIIVEIHPKPEEALSDGAQSLKLDRFDHMMNSIKKLQEALK